MNERPEGGTAPAGEIGRDRAEPASGKGGRTPASRFRRLAALSVLVSLWLVPILSAAAVGYLVWREPERVAAFLAGKPEDMASAAGQRALADRLAGLETAVRAATAESRSALDSLEADDGRIAESIGDLTARLESLGNGLAAVREGLTSLARQGGPLETLGGRIEALETAATEIPELASGLETDGRALAALGTSVAEQRERLGELGGEVAALSATGARASEEIARLRSELAAVVQAGTVAPPGGLADWGALRAAIGLERAVGAGQPFGKELAELEAVADPGFGEWTARAGTGLPTRATLVRKFRELARAHAGRADDLTGISWLDAAVRRVMSAVSVRRVGKELEGDGLAASVGRAEAFVDEGDMAGAVGELDADEAPPFADWLDAARDRLAADAEIAAFLGGLGAGG